MKALVFACLASLDMLLIVAAVLAFVALQREPRVRGFGVRLSRRPRL